MADTADLAAEPDWLAAHADNPGFEWARITWARAAAFPDAWFDDAKADAIVANWPKWFKLTDERFAGEPFYLEPWEEVIVRLTFGWKIPVKVKGVGGQPDSVAWVRLFRRLRLWIPRKNGKSEFLAALGLCIWAYDALMRGSGYVFGRKEKQGRVIFDKMVAMVGLSADLADAITPFGKSLFLKRFFAAFELLPGTAVGTHGGNPYVVLGDEMHEWSFKQIELADNLHQGMGIRLQPFEAYASTAGINSNVAGKSLYDEDVKRLAGQLIDPHTIVAIFALAPDADPFDEANWPISNPSLDRTIQSLYLRMEANAARGNPRATARFKCYHHNQWVDGVSKWLPIAKWDACAATKDGWQKYPQTLKGRLCYGAFDLANTRDVTGFVLVFPPTEDDPKWRVIPRFWVPAAAAAQRVLGDGVPYADWIAPDAPHAMVADEQNVAGKWLNHNGGPPLETTDGDIADHSIVGEAILEAAQLYDLQQVAYDPWNATKLVVDLQKEHQLPAEFFVEFRQGIRSYAEPSRFFEGLVFSGQFDHGGHPVLRWMAQNVAVKFDDNLNFMPHKLKSAEKIDGIVCCVMATALAMGEGEAESPSYLEDDDAEVILM